MRMIAITGCGGLLLAGCATGAPTPAATVTETVTVDAPADDVDTHYKAIDRYYGECFKATGRNPQNAVQTMKTCATPEYARSLGQTYADSDVTWTGTAITEVLHRPHLNGNRVTQELCLDLSDVVYTREDGLSKRGQPARMVNVHFTRNAEGRWLVAEEQPVAVKTCPDIVQDGYR